MTIVGNVFDLVMIQFDRLARIHLGQRSIFIAFVSNASDHHNTAILEFISIINWTSGAIGRGSDDLITFSINTAVHDHRIVDGIERY